MSRTASQLLRCASSLQPLRGPLLKIPTALCAKSCSPMPSKTRERAPKLSTLIPTFCAALPFYTARVKERKTRPAHSTKFSMVLTASISTRPSQPAIRTSTLISSRFANSLPVISSSWLMTTEKISRLITVMMNARKSHLI